MLTSSTSNTTTTTSTNNQQNNNVNSPLTSPSKKQQQQQQSSSTSTSTSISSPIKKNNIHKSTCNHLEPFKVDHDGLNTLAIIQQYILYWKSGPRGSDIKLPSLSCSTCHCFNGRIHLCLQCFHIACWKDKHMKSHFDKSGHYLAIDASSNQIYCNKCNDYIYDNEFDDIMENVRLEYAVSLQDYSNPTPKRVKYHTWKPSEEESNIIEKNSVVVNESTTSSSLLGLRGLNNLGNTCFMNSILQSFIHNPLLRNYFLSDMHCHRRCINRRERELNSHNNHTNGGGSNGNNSGGSDGEHHNHNHHHHGSPSNGVFSDSDNNDNSSSNNIITSSNSQSSSSSSSTSTSSICFGCEMDILFGQIFSGAKIPYTPHQFLYSCWNYSNYFAGYEQQDAHEFLISSLNGIHSHCGGGGSNNMTKEPCNCIVHCTFGGQLKSEVTCTNCKFTSSTTDPFIDISLDIPKSKHHHHHHHNHNNSQDSSDTNNSSSHNNNGDNNHTSHHHTNTLLSCLDRFTQPEKLDEKYFCSQCNSKQESTKQLSFSTLPVVICFHLKRFEQSLSNRRTHKIDTFIEFPLTIDMSPFISSTRKKILKRKLDTLNQNNNSNNAMDKSFINTDEAMETISVDSPSQPSIPSSTPSIIPIDDSFVYELYAVVNHTGKIDSGHYTCFVKHNDQWYKCDDSMITSSSIQDVIQSKGYLLFYLKKQLEYKKKPTTTTRSNINSK